MPGVLEVTQVEVSTESDSEGAEQLSLGFLSDQGGGDWLQVEAVVSW